jgi:hydrogenase-4 membrane subunit HyfE
MNFRKAVIILILGFVGWVLCGATMWIGMATTSMENTLIVHAIAAPLIFAILSLVYFKKFRYTTPLQTAVAFLTVVVFLDVFIVALLINKSFDMFRSILGTWIPFGMIFIATYVTGLYSSEK